MAKEALSDRPPKPQFLKNRWVLRSGRWNKTGRTTAHTQRRKKNGSLKRNQKLYWCRDGGFLKPIGWGNGALEVLDHPQDRQSGTSGNFLDVPKCRVGGGDECALRITCVVQDTKDWMKQEETLLERSGASFCPESVRTLEWIPGAPGEPQKILHRLGVQNKGYTPTNSVWWTGKRIPRDNS